MTSTQGGLARFGARTVLIVDDNQVDRSTYKSFLNDQPGNQFTFFEAEDAAEALKVCRMLHVDCVLLDFELPDVDGLELLDQLRHEGSGELPPTVMITGRGSESIAVEAMQKGATDYVVKSDLNAVSLSRAIHNALERADQAGLVLREQLNREAAERELAQSEERFRLLMDAVVDYAIMMLDAQGLVISWNVGARRLLNYYDREIVGQHYRVLFGPEDVAANAPEAELHEARSNASLNASRWYLKKTGERFWGNSMTTAIVDDIGNLRGYAIVVRDDTRRKQVDARLKTAVALRDDLFVAAAQSLKPPIEASKAEIEALLVSNGHDEVLTKGLLHTRTNLLQVASLAENLESIVEIEAQRAHPPIETVVLADVVKQICDRLAGAFSAAGIGLQMLLDDPNLEVRTVGSWLDKVLKNLLLNAIKYAPGQPITVRTRRRGEQAEVSIQDRGPGLSDAQKSQVFEAEERALRVPVGQKGLGLPVSRRIMESLGGSLWVHSNIDQGATFIVRLPTEGRRDD